MPFDPIWSPLELAELALLRRDERNDGTPDYFDRFFTQNIFAKRGEVRMADLPENDRFLAPFVLPYEQGKPMDTSTKLDFNGFTVPYVKVKSPVRAVEVMNYDPTFLLRIAPREPTIEEAFDARVRELDVVHRSRIANREAWMRARAIIDGKLQIDYERDQGAENPSVLLDFGRDPGLNIVKTDDFWDDPDADILGDLESWMTAQYLAYGGGSASQLIVGAKVAPVFRKNKGILAMLDTRYRGNDDVSIRQGIMRTEQPLQYIGQLTTGLEIWSYKDTFDIPLPNGGKQRVDVFNEKDVLMVAPGANGVHVRGPIFDAEAIQAGLSATPVFAKQWYTKDPSDFWQMHQSSYLPIPLYPNRTAKARVLA